MRLDSIHARPLPGLRNRVDTTAPTFASSAPPPPTPDPDLDLTIGRFFRRSVLYGVPLFLLGLIVGRGCQPAPTPSGTTAPVTAKDTHKDAEHKDATHKATSTKKDH